MPADEELEAANADFYEAFEALDLDRMEAVWATTDDAWCVHPGSELLSGWPRVRRSWIAIFANSEYLQFIVTDVAVERSGDLGVVRCTENVLAPAGPRGLRGAQAHALNVFVRRDGAWRLLAHHAAPVLRAAPTSDTSE